MAQILNYSYSKFRPYLNSYQNKNSSNFINSTNNFDKIQSNNIYSNYSLFNDNEENINPNINHYDFKNDSNIPLSYYEKKEKKHKSKSIEQDFDMMKIQLRCDLIGQKINQMQNQLEDYHKSNSKENKNILRKNRTYNNFKEIGNNYNNKDNKQNNLEKINFFKIPIQNKKENRRGDIFRKKRSENISHNISYINKNINSNYYTNRNYNKKTTPHKIMNNNLNINGVGLDNFRQTFFKNTMNMDYQNQTQKHIINNLNENKYNNTNPNIIKQKKQNFVQINNYINGYNNKKIIPKSYEKINQKKSAKSKRIKRSCSQNNFSTNLSSNKTRKINYSNYINNFKTKLNSVSSYGSFDQFFNNDNNYSDSSFIKYINTIKNNFYSINYTNLNKIKQKSFRNDNQISKNNLVIQKGYDFNIINNNKKDNFKDINHKKEIDIKNIKIQDSKNIKKFKNLNKTFDSIHNMNNQNRTKINYDNNFENKNQPTQINNNFNVNNNTNYYNFNYNQNNRNNNYKKKMKNNKDNDMKNIKSKNNILNNQGKINHEILKENIEENSTNDYMKYHHDYSNDDFMNTSDMYNSIIDDKKYNFIKKPNIIYEKKNKSNLNTKRKKSNLYN